MFIAPIHELQPRLYALTLSSYYELLTLYISEAALTCYRTDEPLFLTCVNGRRDPCCAKHGAALFPAMVKAAGAQAWQCSHIGGHRFAATGICFPQGWYFGQVSPDEAGRLVDLVRSGQMYYERSRGRTCYPREVQIAEQMLRERTGERRFDAYALHDAVQTDSLWRVEFHSTDGQRHPVSFTEQSFDWETYTSCDAEQPKRDLVYTPVASV